MKINALILSGISALMLPSCMSMFLKDHNFKKTEAVTINGAQVNSAVKPMGGSSGFSLSAMIFSAGAGTLDGPFLWRVEAVGDEGTHEWLQINQAKVTTETTKRSEPFPRNLLNIRAKFEPLPGEEGKSFAKIQIPGKLTVFPRKDGKVKIDMNISVRANGKTETKWLRFELSPESKWRNETIFLPTEIIKNFRGNPREWDW